MTAESIKTRPIKHIGARTIAATTESGEIHAGYNKGGEITKAFKAGDVLLYDNRTNAVIAGPFSFEELRELATQICGGNARAATAPESLLILAAGILGFAGNEGEAK